MKRQKAFCDIRSFISMLFLVLLLVTSSSAALYAAEDTCDLSTVIYAYKDLDQWLVEHLRSEVWLFSNKTCEIKNISWPHYQCSITAGFQHGSQGFNCEKSLSGSWSLKNASDPHSYLGTVGSGHDARAPDLKTLKSEYAYLNDDDAAKPIYAEDFPKHFTEIGPKRHIDNPDFDASMQVIRYVTMAGEPRVAVTSEAIVGCKKLQFNVWVRHVDNKEKLESIVNDMATFLTDLHLEPIIDPIPKLQGGFNNSEALKQVQACNSGTKGND
jgi:hypothetical protein